MMMYATGAISIKEFIAFAEKESWCNEDDEAYDSFAYSLNKGAMMTLSNSPTNMNKQATLRGTRKSLVSNGAWLDGDVNDSNEYDSDTDDASATNALVHGMKVSFALTLLHSIEVSGARTKCCALQAEAVVAM
jgi:hypothetical protein